MVATGLAPGVGAFASADRDVNRRGRDAAGATRFYELEARV